MKRIAWVACLAACGGGGIEPKPEPATDTAQVIDGKFVEPLREAARAYASWGRVDQRPAIAPMMCDMPRDPDLGSTGDVHLSRADDSSPHGRKLYFLYANRRDAYLALDSATGALDVGFTVVKEAFAPREVTKAAAEALRPPEEEVRRRTYETFEPAPGKAYVEQDGAYLVPDAPLGLYVLTKVGDAGEPDTDAGWIYGTITQDGAVTSVGRVGSCMGCHVDQAPHERLYGVVRRGTPSP